MSATTGSRMPRVLLASRTRHEIPLSDGDARKFAALDRELNWHLLARSRRRYRSDRITLLGRARLGWLDGILFQVRLPFAIARAVRRLQTDVLVAQDPFIGAAALLARGLARRNVAVVVEVHGDWCTATRLYGRQARRVLGKPADLVARWAIRRADAVRTVSAYTTRLVEDVTGTVDAEFPAFVDLDDFFATPPLQLPALPTALFVGVLERYKNVDGLLEAWGEVHALVPEARLRIVGRGSLAPLIAQAASVDESIEYRSRLSRQGVAAALDAATCLVLPSRSEGWGRVVLEAFSRGRPVVATATGGLRELVHDGANGLLVPPGDTAALRDALLALLRDRKLAVTLGANGFASADDVRSTPQAFALAVGELVELARSRRVRSVSAAPRVPALRG